MVGCRHAYYIITCYVLHPLLLARFVREGSAAWRPAARGTNPYYEVRTLLLFIYYHYLCTPNSVRSAPYNWKELHLIPPLFLQ